MTKYYLITSIPDPNQSSLHLQFGDIRQSVISGWKKMLHILSEMPPESISFSLCFSYSPSLDEGLQGRLKIWVKIITESQRMNAVSTLIKNGPVSEFYNFKEDKGNGDTLNIKWDNIKAIAEIIRKIDLVYSYVPKSENFRISSKPYKAILPFLPNEDNDYLELDRLLSGLTSNIYYEVLIQPTTSKNEIDAIYAGIYNLGMINEDVFYDPITPQDKYRREFGFMKDHFAEEIFNEYQELVTNLRNPQLEFSVRIAGENTSDVNLVASSIAESVFLEGKYRILMANEHDENFKDLIKHYKESTIDIHWQHNSLVSEPIRKITRMASVEELSGVFRLPVASDISPRTIRKSTDPFYTFDANTETILIGDDIETGSVSSRQLDGNFNGFFKKPEANYLEHRLNIELLKKHMFICGVPGSGKTTAIFNLLIQLHHYNKPFLVVEPAKTEYRILKTLKNHKNKQLKSLGESIKIFTPGNENVSPFRFNPFAYPEGISKDEHINNLMDCFKAAMPIPGDTPLPALLGKAVEDLYDDDLGDGFPSMEDLVKKVKALMDSPDLEYDPEIKGNLKTAIEVRLSPLVSTKRSIGKIFSKDEGIIDITSIIETPTIIEMDSLNTEQSNLLTLFILTSLREYIKVNRRSGSKLKHIVVLEEAHNVAGKIPEGSNPDDPRKKASDYICRMLAELRALGEGIIIADQLPSTVASEVIKNTTTKLAHRLTSMDDREEIGYTMLLGANELEDFARLQVGQAFYYTEGLYRPRRIQCINSNVMLGFVGGNDQPPMNKELYELIENDEWFRKRAKSNLNNKLESFMNKQISKSLILEKYNDTLNEFMKVIDKIPKGNEDKSDSKKAEIKTELFKLSDAVDNSLTSLNKDKKDLDSLMLKAKRFQPDKILESNFKSAFNMVESLINEAEEIMYSIVRIIKSITI